MPLHIHCFYFLNFLPKLIFSNTEKNNSIPLYQKLLVDQTVIPVGLYLVHLWHLALTLMLWPIYVFSIQPFWPACIIWCITFLSRVARTSDMIFFITDICLHFDKSSLMPFLFDTIITAKYCEYAGCSWSKQFIKSMDKSSHNSPQSSSYKSHNYSIWAWAFIISSSNGANGVNCWLLLLTS